MYCLFLHGLQRPGPQGFYHPSSALSAAFSIKRKERGYLPFPFPHTHISVKKRWESRGRLHDGAALVSTLASLLKPAEGKGRLFKCHLSFCRLVKEWRNRGARKQGSAS